jgi:ferritin-like metal-binding protein YciE
MEIYSRVSYIPFVKKEIMKSKIQSIEDAFVFTLQQLIYLEEEIRQGIFHRDIHATSPRLKQEIGEYEQSADSKLLKLERIFNYLMREPYSRKTVLVTDILEETNSVLAATPAGHVKDILITNAFKSINACKITTYKTAYLYSVELELDTPSDLLQQMLDWEINSGKNFTKLAIEEFNRLQLAEVKRFD